MTSTVFLDLIFNAGLLLGLAVVLDLVSAGAGATPGVGRRWGGRLLAGLAVGLIGIGLMAAPMHAEPGVQFDTRSVLLSVTGLFLGPVPTVIAMVVTSAFRVWLSGAWVIGILVIVTSGTIGLIWRSGHDRLTGQRRLWSLYALGVLVHVVMLSLIATIPDGVGPRVLNQVFLPVILVYPFATVALGLLLSQRVEREAAMVRIRQHDVERDRLIAALEQSDDSIVITDASGSIEYVNPAFEAVTGYSREEALGNNPRLLKSGEQEDATYRAVVADAAVRAHVARPTGQQAQGRVAVFRGRHDFPCAHA